MPWCFGDGVRGGVGGQAMLAFSNGLHTNLGVAIGRREGFGATGREAISAQDIGFLGVAADEESEGVSQGGVLSERSRTISGVGIARGKSFGDEGGDEGGEEVIDSVTKEVTKEVRRLSIRKQVKQQTAEQASASSRAECGYARGAWCCYRIWPSACNACT
ncbi:hypothetical protein G7Y79_00006g020380 [Physcia stellaris]|nr:hypothetical protein G7Y79_00006g020380 [Physcia stellaris]